MVVKVKKEGGSSCPEESSVLSGPPRGICKSHSGTSSKDTEIEFSRLKNLLPSISTKSSVSKLDVILEAISYIDQLQDQLLEQINRNNLPLSATELLVGKENKK